MPHDLSASMQMHRAH